MYSCRKRLWLAPRIHEHPDCCKLFDMSHVFSSVEWVPLLSNLWSWNRHNQMLMHECTSWNWWNSHHQECEHMVQQLFFHQAILMAESSRMKQSCCQVSCFSGRYPVGKPMDCWDCSHHLRWPRPVDCGRGWRVLRLSAMCWQWKSCLRPAGTHPELPPPQTMISTSVGTTMVLVIGLLVSQAQLDARLRLHSSVVMKHHIWQMWEETSASVDRVDTSMLMHCNAEYWGVHEAVAWVRSSMYLQSWSSELGAVYHSV